MFRFDPAGVAYAVAAVALVGIALVTWRRRALNRTVAGALVVVTLATGWWAVADAVAVAAVDDRWAGVACLAMFPGQSVTVAAFVHLAGTIARAHGGPGRRVVALLGIEPVLITVAAATNPWHGLVYDGAGRADLTGSALWRFGPVFWAQSFYGYAALALGIGLIARAWVTAPPPFRAQRLCLLLAVLVPVAGNVLNLLGALPIALDPTPVALAVTGLVMAYGIFSQHLFTFTPVARARIIEQISDAIVAVSPMGVVVDLNSAAVLLVTRLQPEVTQIVGARAQDLFGAAMAATGEEPTEVAVELDGRPARLHVSRSPLLGRNGRSLGSVLVARDVTEATAQSRRLAEANAQLTQQLQTIEQLRADLTELVSRDPLTGLRNRRHLVAEFEEMLDRAVATGEPLTVVLFDVDRFKSVNDRHGHLAGDAVLVAVADLLSAAAPDGALVARWGGEEFFVALPGVRAADGAAFADRLRGRLEANGVSIAGRTIGCTVSGGVAAYPACGATTDALFHAADVLLHEAKRSGRNRILGGDGHGPAGDPGDASPGAHHGSPGSPVAAGTGPGPDPARAADRSAGGDRH